MGRKTEKRLAKMVMRLAKREAKAHRLLAEYSGHQEMLKFSSLGYTAWWEDWFIRVEAFLKDGMVDDDVLS